MNTKPNPETIYPYRKLTVIVRNISPFVHLQEPCSVRRVTIDLTKEQVKALGLKYIGCNCGTDMHEEVSSCFLEEDSEQ